MAKKATKKQEAAPQVTPDGTREHISIKHTFTTEEKDAMLSKYFQKLRAADLKREAGKNAKSTADAEAKMLKGDADELGSKIQDGYEMQTVEALVEYDRKTGLKRYYRNAPGKPEHREFLKEDSMTEDDFQRLPLEEGAAAQPEPQQPELATT